MKKFQTLVVFVAFTALLMSTGCSKSDAEMFLYLEAVVESGEAVDSAWVEAGQSVSVSIEHSESAEFESATGGSDSYLMAVHSESKGRKLVQVYTANEPQIFKKTLNEEWGIYVPFIPELFRGQRIGFDTDRGFSHIRDKEVFKNTLSSVSLPEDRTGDMSFVYLDDLSYVYFERDGYKVKSYFFGGESSLQAKEFHRLLLEDYRNNHYNPSNVFYNSWERSHIVVSDFVDGYGSDRSFGITKCYVNKLLAGLPKGLTGVIRIEPRKKSIGDDNFIWEYGYSYNSPKLKFISSDSLRAELQKLGN